MRWAGLSRTRLELFGLHVIAASVARHTRQCKGRVVCFFYRLSISGGTSTVGGVSGLTGGEHVAVLSRFGRTGGLGGGGGVA